MFGWDDAFLLAMSASGALIQANQGKKNQKLIRAGRALEQASFETNLESLRAQNSEASLDAIQQLRQNIANQIATNAARGVSSGAGSALTAIQKSESSFTKDEQVRRINLLTKESQLRANNVLSGLHTLTSETRLGQSLTNQIFKNLPVTSLAKKFGSSLGSVAEDIGTAIGKKAGYGLNTI